MNQKHTHKVSIYTRVEKTLAFLEDVTPKMSDLPQESPGIIMLYQQPNILGTDKKDTKRQQ